MRAGAHIFGADNDNPAVGVVTLELKFLRGKKEPRHGVKLGGAPAATGTPTSQKKVSHGDVAKLPCIFSYLAPAFEASPAQAITNCDNPT